MPKFLVTIHRHQDDHPQVFADPAMHQAIDELNDEMIAAGVRLFVGGLQPIRTARSLRRQSDGAVVLTEGGYLQTPEYVDGFWVLAAENLDEALTWGRKAAAACRASVEVRPFL